MPAQVSPDPLHLQLMLQTQPGDRPLGQSPEHTSLEHLALSLKYLSEITDLKKNYNVNSFTKECLSGGGESWFKYVPFHNYLAKPLLFKDTFLQA